MEIIFLGGVGNHLKHVEMQKKKFFFSNNFFFWGGGGTSPKFNGMILGPYLTPPPSFVEIRRGLFPEYCSQTNKQTNKQTNEIARRASTCRNITLDQIQIGDNRMFHNYCSLGSGFIFVFWVRVLVRVCVRVRIRVCVRVPRVLFGKLSQPYSAWSACRPNFKPIPSKLKYLLIFKVGP